LGEVTGFSTARLPISAPVALTGSHALGAFDSGKPALDDWLKTRAMKAEGRSARTYVVTSGEAVVGYYCFATGGVRLDDAPTKLRRNMPQMVPVILIGRLAVDKGYQGLGIGKGLLKDALLRAVQAAEIVGTRAVLVHAIDTEAAAFYRKFGFVEYPEQSHTFFLPMETISAAL
jgi:GNAT superfamily N-acetyltransferase